jgi:hypothetical protein
MIDMHIFEDPDHTSRHSGIQACMHACMWMHWHLGHFVCYVCLCMWEYRHVGTERPNVHPDSTNTDNMICA